MIFGENRKLSKEEKLGKNRAFVVTKGTLAMAKSFTAVKGTFVVAKSFTTTKVTLPRQGRRTNWPTFGFAAAKPCFATTKTLFTVGQNFYFVSKSFVFVHQ